MPYVTDMQIAAVLSVKAGFFLCVSIFSQLVKAQDQAEYLSICFSQFKCQMLL